MNKIKTRQKQMNEVKDSFEYYIEIQNDEGITLDGIDDIFQLLFNKDDDTISNSLHIRGLRTSSNGGEYEQVHDMFTQDRFILQHAVIIGHDHIEVKLIREGKRYSQVWYDILEVDEGGKVSSIEPYLPLRHTKNRILIAMAA
jgi:hypothetical protein